MLLVQYGETQVLQNEKIPYLALEYDMVPNSAPKVKIFLI
jgi:hypothetical protein